MPALEERRYLFAAVRDVLETLAREKPLVILIDDVHWADAPSLVLLEYLAPSLRDVPILIMATYTRDESPHTNRLDDLLERMQRQKLARSITLDDLEPSEVEQLLVAIAESTPPAEVVDELFRATHGNPFFVDEVVRQLADDGLLGPGRDWDPLRDLDIGVPESVRLSIRNKLEALYPNTRRIVTSVSLLGRDFGFDLLEALRELPEDDLVDALDEAERARIIMSSVDAGTVRFTFAHDLIRRTLADDISSIKRQRLHAHLADALQEVNSDALAEHAAAIAHHLESAGRWAETDRTIRFLVMAGERALEAAAHSEALTYFERARSRLPVSDLKQRACVLEGLGTTERSLGHLDTALAYWGDALDAMEQMGDALSAARLCLDAALQVAWWRRGTDTMRLVDRGLLALENRPSALRAGFCALAGQIASQSGMHGAAESALHDALTVARTHDDERMLGLALYSAAAHHFLYHQYPLTVDEARESIKHLREAGDLWNLANVLGYLGTSLGWLGDFESAAETGLDGATLARRLGNWSAYVFAEQSQTFREVGRRPNAAVLEERGRWACDLGQEMRFPWLRSVGYARIGLAEFWRGRWAKSAEAYEQAARVEVRGAAGGHIARLFLLYAYLGDASRALELINEARAEFPVLGQPNSATKWGLAAAAVEALYVLGETDECAALYDAMVELAATGSLMRTWDYRLIETLLGMSAASANDWIAAEAHYQAALRAADRLPMLLEGLDAARFYAEALLARGLPTDRDTTRALAERAIDGYTALEMPRHTAMARSVLG